MKIRNKEYGLTKIIFSIILVGVLAVIIVILWILSEKGSQTWMYPTAGLAVTIGIGVIFIWVRMRRNEKKKYR